MPNKKSAAKHMRQSKKRNLRNRSVRSTLHTHTKKIRKAIEEKNYEDAKAQLPATIKVINKTAQKGIVHKRKAARLESRIVKQVTSLSPNQKEAPSSS